jgi:hypothetical protein
MRSDGDNGTSNDMEPVTLGSPGTAPAQAYLDPAKRLKGDVIAASERQACSAAVRPGSCLNLLSVLRSIEPATPWATQTGSETAHGPAFRLWSIAAVSGLLYWAEPSCRR